MQVNMDPGYSIPMDTYFNPTDPKVDQHLISPYNFTPESNIKVMRIKEMITI